MDIRIIGDESNVDAVNPQFLFQSLSQVIPPLRNEDIIS
jgi:hypothetical protein